jgi:hypothetical protein
LPGASTLGEARAPSLPRGATAGTGGWGPRGQRGRARGSRCGIGGQVKTGGRSRHAQSSTHSAQHTNRTSNRAVSPPLLLPRFASSPVVVSLAAPPAATSWLLVRYRGRRSRAEHRAAAKEGEGACSIHLATSRSSSTSRRVQCLGEPSPELGRGGGSRGCAEAQNNRQGIYCRHLLPPPLSRAPLIPSPSPFRSHRLRPLHSDPPLFSLPSLLPQTFPFPARPAKSSSLSPCTRPAMLRLGF